jgi:hypothetical protein
MSELILYTTEDGQSRIQLRADNDTVWLSQLEMAELFNATKQNISLHLKNLFEKKELDEGAVVKESLTTATNGKDVKDKPIDFSKLSKGAIQELVDLMDEEDDA